MSGSRDKGRCGRSPLDRAHHQRGNRCKDFGLTCVRKICCPGAIFAIGAEGGWRGVGSSLFAARLLCYLPVGWGRSGLVGCPMGDVGRVMREV